MKTLAKSVAILRLFIKHYDGLTVEQMATNSGINKATVRRIADELVECGLLKKPHKRGMYSLGMLFLSFSSVLKANNILVEIAIPYLNQLSRDLTETASLALWDGKCAVIYQSIYPDQALKATINEGTVKRLHYTCLGKAILAELPLLELQRYCSTGLERSAPNTITDPGELQKHLNVVRRDGVAYDDEEYEIGIRGVAAVLKNIERSVIGAICILGPSTRLNRERLTEYGDRVRKCADAISRDLGYKGP
jgi:IclR family transcriptional regulator, KDG regulon repressor